jgi:hypothetical protein
VHSQFKPWPACLAVLEGVDMSGYLEEIRAWLIFKSVTVKMLRDKDFSTAAEKARLAALNTSQAAP